MLAQRLPGLLPPLSRRGVAGDLDGPFHGRPDRQGALTRARPFRAPAPFGQHGRAHRRRHWREARRGLPGAQRRAVPGRAAGIQPPGAGYPAPAAGDGRGDGGARQRPYPLSGPGAAGGGDEPCRCGYGGAGTGHAARRRAASRTIRAASPGRCSTASTCTVDVPPVTAADLALPPPAEGTAEVAARVAAAREIQAARAGRRRGRRARSTPAPKGAGWRPSPRSTRRAGPCWPAPPRPAASRARGWTPHPAPRAHHRRPGGPRQRAPRARGRGADLSAGGAGDGGAGKHGRECSEFDG